MDADGCGLADDQTVIPRATVVSNRAMAAAALPLTIAVRADQLDAVDEVCGAALGCAQSDLLGQLLVLVVFGLVTVFVLAAAQRVNEARAELAAERSRTSTEQEAFARFARQVAGVEPSAGTYQLTSTDGGASAVSVADPPPPDDRLETVRDAYRETVMAMDHYEAEYGEPLARNLREEFGEEIAMAVMNGDQLTPELKNVLVERAREAAHERERLRYRLDREADALESAHDELQTVGAAVQEAEQRALADRGYRELVDEWNRLGELESRISRLLTRRQEALQSRRLSGGADPWRSIRSYLYGDLGTTFPVLSDGAALADRVKGARSRVLGALTNRV